MELYFGIFVLFWGPIYCRDAFSHPRYLTMWLPTVGSLWLSLFGPQTWYRADDHFFCFVFLGLF